MSIFEASYTSSSYSGQTNNIIIYVLFTYTGVQSHYNMNTTGVTIGVGSTHTTWAHEFTFWF
jgi:hypothetical protein